MRKLLIIKKQKEWDKEFKKEKVALCLSDCYRNLDWKDFDIICNDRKMLLKAVNHLRVSDISHFYLNIYGNKYISSKKFKLDNVVEDYIDFLFELKEKINIRLNAELIINLSELKNVLYVYEKYHVGEKLIQKIKSNEDVRKEIKKSNLLNVAKSNIFIDDIIKRKVMYLANIFKTKKSNNELDFDVKKYFDINIIKNF